jgi:hypothetical protein
MDQAFWENGCTTTTLACEPKDASPRVVSGNV